MIPVRLSSCLWPDAPSLRSSLTLPFPHHIDVAPQLVAVYLAQAALAAAHRALDSAHPILGIAPRPDWDPYLTDTEFLAALVRATAAHLAALLRDYDAAVVRDLGDREELQCPF
jgi:hypothetical protein